GVGFGPRRFDPAPASSPRARAARHAVRWDEYNPSRRSSAPTSPGFRHRSASWTTRRLYAAVKRLRSALPTTSTSCFTNGSATNPVMVPSPSPSTLNHQVVGVSLILAGRVGAADCETAARL